MAATVSVGSITRDSVQITISNLQYTTDKYIFRIRLENEWYNSTNNEYYEWTVTPTSNTAYTFIVTVYDITPHTGYYTKVYATYNGTEYPLNVVYFETLDITRPSATQYLPTYIPQVLSQWVYIREPDGTLFGIGEANCCVASALVSALSILEYKEKGTTNHQYSTSYIYGNRNLQGDAPPSSSGTSTTENGGMYLDSTLDQMRTDGTPVWTRIPENKDYRYPDNRFYEDNFITRYGTGGIGARTVFHNARYNNTQIYAYKQCLNQRQNINFYDCQAVANAILTNGYYFFNFNIPDNFYDLESDGIVPEPSGFFGNGGHVMVIIGWKTILGIKYWIALNSWGDWWGDNGLCYIPMDWGCNSTHVEENARDPWVWMGYTASAKTVTSHACPIKKWNGSYWESCPTKMFNGTSWVSVPTKIFQ